MCWPGSAGLSRAGQSSNRKDNRKALHSQLSAILYRSVFLSLSFIQCFFFIPLSHSLIDVSCIIFLPLALFFFWGQISLFFSLLQTHCHSQGQSRHAQALIWLAVGTGSWKNTGKLVAPRLAHTKHLIGTSCGTCSKLLNVPGWQRLPPLYLKRLSCDWPRWQWGHHHLILLWFRMWSTLKLSVTEPQCTLHYDSKPDVISSTVLIIYSTSPGSSSSSTWTGPTSLGLR